MLTSDELTNLRADAVTTLWDTCVVQTSATEVDSHGQPTITYSGSGSVACGFRYRTAQEMYRSDGSVAETDAELRLPMGTTLTRDCRIQLTHRRGIALANPVYFQVHGEPRGGTTTIVVDLERIS